MASTNISLKYTQMMMMIIIIILVLQPGSAFITPTALLKEKVQLNPYFNFDKYKKTLPKSASIFTEISQILIHLLVPFKLQCSYQEKSEIIFNYI